MLLEVVRLEQLDALICDAFVQLQLFFELLVSLEKQIYHSAGAVLFVASCRILVNTLKDGLLLLVSLPKLIIWEITVAALVNCSIF